MYIYIYTSNIYIYIYLVVNPVGVLAEDLLLLLHHLLALAVHLGQHLDHLLGGRDLYLISYLINYIYIYMYNTLFS